MAIMARCAGGALLLVAVCLHLVQGKLVLLMTLTRHGSRAPNTITDKICPNDDVNQERFNVPYEQLTEYGMAQLYAFGEHLRKKYVEEMKFLPPTAGERGQGHFYAHFIADSADRCIQSGETAARALYPDSTAPGGFRMQPFSVWTMPLQMNNLFCAPKAACKQVNKAHLDKYYEERGKKLLEEHADLLANVSEICGVKIQDIPLVTKGKEDVVLGIKDIADQFVFDEDQRLPMTIGLSQDMRYQLRSLAFQMLQERYYGTPEGVTYWSSDMPHFFLANMRAATTRTQKYLYIGLHGHRELLYALSHLFGWHHSYPGLPEEQIPPGTTMEFELHQDDHTKEYFLRFFEWAPPEHMDGDRKQVKLDKCDFDCPLDDFENIIYSHIEKTGSWQEICNYQGDIYWNHTINSSYMIFQSDLQPSGSGGALPVAVFVASVTIVALLAIAVKKFAKAREGYTVIV